jgi:hypothetical protein
MNAWYLVHKSTGLDDCEELWKIFGNCPFYGTRLLLGLAKQMQAYGICSREKRGGDKALR